MINIMDTPSNGDRDSRFGMTYDNMSNMLGGTSGQDLYNSSVLHNRQTSIPSGLSRSSMSSLGNACNSNLQRGLKRSSLDMCYDQNRVSMLNITNETDLIEENYTSPIHIKGSPPSNGKKTKGRVKIKMEYIDNKLRRYTTFSKRKTGIMKKAYELSTLTGTQVMLLVASETGHVYTFATRKLQPMITSEAGKALIQTCLNSPDPCGGGSTSNAPTGDQRMSATGFEETELSYNIGDDSSADKAMDSYCYSESGGESSEPEEMPSCSSPPPLLPINATSSVEVSQDIIRCSPLATSLLKNSMKKETHGKFHDKYLDNVFQPNDAKENKSQENLSWDDEEISIVAAKKNNEERRIAGGWNAEEVSIVATKKPSPTDGICQAENSRTFTLNQLQRKFGIRGSSSPNSATDLSYAPRR